MPMEVDTWYRRRENEAWRRGFVVGSLLTFAGVFMLWVTLRGAA